MSDDPAPRPLLDEATLDEILLELGSRFSSVIVCMNKIEKHGLKEKEKWSYRYIGGAFAVMGLLDCSLTDLSHRAEILPEDEEDMSDEDDPE